MEFIWNIKLLGSPRSSLFNGNCKKELSIKNFIIYNVHTQPEISLQNRLEIYQDSVIVSLEKAYNLFFRTKTDLIDNNKLTREEYIIYSHLMRSGCTIQKYKNEESTKQSNVDNEQQPLKQLYTWNYLYELLGHQKQTIPSQSIDNCLYNEIKSSMDDIVKKITMRSPSSSTATHETINYLGKRKADVKPKEVLLQKKNSVNPSPEYFGNGALNDFMIGSDFQNFKSIFSQLDVIKLSSLEDCNDDHVTDSLQKLSFCFDLWVDGSYKKSDIRKPNYRIVVLRYVHEMPNSRLTFLLNNSLTLFAFVEAINGIFHKVSASLIYTNDRFTNQL